MHDYTATLLDTDGAVIALLNRQSDLDIDAFTDELSAEIDNSPFASVVAGFSVVESSSIPAFLRVQAA